MVEKFPEITINYSNPTPMYDRIKITCSGDVNRHLLEICDDIEYRESMYAVFLNRANHVLGYLLVSKGGISGTVVDVRIIMQAALRANSSSFVLAHSHPSGNTQPSQEDIKVTEKIKKAAKLLDICLLDHLILTSEKYLSMADEGLI